MDRNLAQRLGGTIVGQQVRFGVQPDFQELEVVGVAQSARILDPRDGTLPVLYVPVLQYPGYGSSGQVLVRGRLPGLLAQAAARQVESLGRDTAISVRTLEEAGAQALAEERALAALAAFVGAMALVLAGTGLFGLISYATRRRRREMGIRLALGATRQQHSPSGSGADPAADFDRDDCRSSLRFDGWPDSCESTAGSRSA